MCLGLWETSKKMDGDLDTEILEDFKPIYDLRKSLLSLLWARLDTKIPGKKPV